MRNNIINSVFNSAAKVAGSVDYSVFDGSQYLYAEHDGDLLPINRPGDYWMLTGKYIISDIQDPHNLEPMLACFYGNTGIWQMCISVSASEGSSLCLFGKTDTVHTALTFVSALPVNTEINVAFLLNYSDNKIYAYINGVEVPGYVFQDLSLVDDTEIGNFYINVPGTKDDGSGNNITIKDIRIFHTNEVSNLSSIIAGSEIGTEVAWWNLEEGLTDKSGNGYDLTAVGF